MSQFLHRFDKFLPNYVTYSTIMVTCLNIL
uniref:Uncharacterized protein n=1 Tax=Rhizophora mucronata TaxID=61149 RepID=A0A2P2NX18_RHIMU